MLRALLRIVFSRRVKLADQARVQVSLTLGARRSEFVALVDTGNSLTDPISAMPVMVICPHAAAPLLGANAALLELDAVAFVETAADIPELRGRLRLIPYSAVGGGGVLAAFRPDLALFVEIHEDSCEKVPSSEHKFSPCVQRRV